MPKLPTVASGGLPGFEAFIWNGIVVRAGTPEATVARLHAELKKALAQPDVQEKIRTLGFEPIASSPRDFREYMSTESARSAQVVRNASIRLE